MNKKIAFHSNQLGLRGTEVALYAYARYNEEILGNKSIIISKPHSNLDTIQKFKNRFDVHLIEFGSCDSLCTSLGVDYLYVTKAGDMDGYYSNKIPTIVHAVFCINQPHGYRYVYISDWLARNQGYDAQTHSLPYIVEKLPDPSYDLRVRLGIPADAVVFGCYGGSTEFNINFVQEAIANTVHKNDNIYFIFMNINKFSAAHKQIIHLPGTWNLDDKSAFIHATNAMIHARKGGETFGLAVAEFTMSNKPVITFSGSGERNHIEILGDKGIYYNDTSQLLDIFNNLSKYAKYTDYFKLYDQHTPEIIMSKFETLIQ